MATERWIRWPGGDRAETGQPAPAEPGRASGRQPLQGPAEAPRAVLTSPPRGALLGRRDPHVHAGDFRGQLCPGREALCPRHAWPPSPRAKRGSSRAPAHARTCEGGARCAARRAAWGWHLPPSRRRPTPPHRSFYISHLQKAWASVLSEGCRKGRRGQRGGCG